MDFDYWHSMVSNAVWWQKIDEQKALYLYHRTVACWGVNTSYYVQGPDTVDLTKLYEQFRLVETLKGNYRGDKKES